MAAPELDLLRRDPEAARLLWDWCEFAVHDEAEPPDWFRSASGRPLKVIGRDGAGGRFCLFPDAGDDSGRLLCIDSEGSAGTIAHSLVEGIRMMLALPYWRDCLHFSGGGVFAEMLKAQERLEADLADDWVDVAATRTHLSARFRIAPVPGELEALHRIVGGADDSCIVAPDGTPFDRLFKGFVVGDNPFWR